MTKNIIIAVLFIIMIISVAYAMAPVPMCFMNTLGTVCTNVTSSNPLPTYVP